MSRLITLSLVSLTALAAILTAADAQTRRPTVREEAPLVLRVRPRSFLEPGNIVPVDSIERQRSGLWQTRSYLVMPPWHNMRDRFGEGELPDPIHGPFIGANTGLR